MEDLREKVYECTLAVEAHMICDLLARSGISARVDGEFLAGALGELPLGNAIKVRVDPARAVEARAVIDEWERMQPPEPTPLLQRSPLPAAAWFALGLVCGALVMFVALRPVERVEAADLDGDGTADTTYKYRDDELEEMQIDHDRDGRHDVRYVYAKGLLISADFDRDGDGKFERHVEYDSYGASR